MCEAILEMMQDELNEKFEDGKKLGEDIGRKLCEERINALNQKLSTLGRIDDIIKASSDASYQQKLLEEFNNI